MAFSGTYRKLTIEQPAGRLMSFPILVSVIGIGIIQILFQAATVVVLFMEPWYAANKCTEAMTPFMMPCIENSSIFLVSIFQYTTVSAAFMVGKPFRKPFYTNFWYTIVIICLTILNLLMLFNPFNWQAFYPNANGDQNDEPISMILTRKIKEFNFQYTLFVIIVINCIFTCVWERIIVVYSSKWWKDHKRAKKALRHQDF